MKSIYDITGLPIVIATNYRTGGTAYGQSVARYNGIPFYSEPEVDLQEFARLQTDVDIENHMFVVKMIAFQIEQQKIYQDLLAMPQSYKIKWSRRDTLHQCASEYVGLMTNVWHHYNAPSTDETATDRYVADDYYYTVPIDNEMIHHAQIVITHCQKVLDQLPIKWDQELFYEDHTDFNTNNKVTVKPANYDEIVEIYRTRLPAWGESLTL
jgi:hypothetical protein